jgi:anti-sigma regulatory factor (Ser/Thr protein kinase)
MRHGCAVSVTESRQFSPMPSSVSDARHFVQRALASCPPEIVDRVQLITSELATNCVVHARTPFQVQVTSREGEIKVEVRDSSHEQPVARRPRNDEPTGRGLMIVDALSDDWGVLPIGRGGSTVWFTMRWP